MKQIKHKGKIESMSVSLMLNKIAASLRRDQLDEIQGIFKQYASNMLQYTRDFYYTPINELGCDDGLKALLTALNIPVYAWGRYVNQRLNLYDFFQELKAFEGKECPRVSKIVTEIEALEHHLDFKKIKIAALLLGVGALASASFIYFGVLSLAQGLITTSLFIPLLGLLRTIGLAIFSLYQNAKESKLKYYRLLHTDYFVVLNSVVKSLAYVFLLVAVSTLNYIAIGLFILESLLLIVNQAVSLYQIFKHKNDFFENPKEEDKGLSFHQQRIRLECNYKKACNEALIKLIGTIVVSTIVIAMHIVSPGWMVVAGGFAIMGAVFLMELFFQHRSKKAMQRTMLMKFEEVETHYSARASESEPNKQQEESALRKFALFAKKKFDENESHSPEGSSLNVAFAS